MTSGSDLFRSPRIRLASAKEDIRDLETQMKRFFGDEPYTSVTEPESDGVHVAVKIQLTKPLPEKWGHKCARIAEDLRSALDQVGHACAVASGVADPKNAYFPFSSDSAHFENIVRGRCKDLPNEVRALFSGYEAYKGGNDVLWALNELCSGSKHRFIEPVGHAVGDAYIKELAILESRGYELFHGPWDREKNEVLVMRYTVGDQFTYDISIAFSVVFGEIEVLRGRHVIPVLRHFYAVTREIVSATIALTKGLKLV